MGFFNGVWNTPQQAADSLAALRVLIGTKFSNEPVQYVGLYNHTGSTAGGTGLQDISEVFIQRAIEIDSTGELGKRWEYFWENISGDKPLTEKLIELVPSAGGLFSQLYTDTMSKAMAGWSYLISNPPTDEDYDVHNAKLDAEVARGRMIILVAHSQGNLFLNHGYDYILESIGQDSVKAVHIAPASSTIRGEYLLTNIDIVINGLRLQGFNSVPDNNLPLTPSLSDKSGHTLTGTYLDPLRPGRSEVSSAIQDAMQLLTAPSTCVSAPPLPPSGVSSVLGNQQVSINWNTVNGATSYNIYWANNSSVSKTNGIQISNASAPYLHSNLINGTPYYYVVTAINTFGESSESNLTYAIPQESSSQEGLIITVAGNGTPGYGGDGGSAVNAAIYSPSGIEIDLLGNLYIADRFNNRIRKVDTDGNISTIAGNGEYANAISEDGVVATSTALHEPWDIATDMAGNVYIAEMTGMSIRKVDVNGIITTVAGMGNGNWGFSGDGGPAAEAELYYPRSIAIDTVGNLYIADRGNNRIRKVDTNGIISTIAGNGKLFYDGDGILATNASLWAPSGVAIDGFGNLYIADTGHNRIRKVDANGIITTVAGNGLPDYSGDGGLAVDAELDKPAGLAVDESGNLYIGDVNNWRVRRVDTQGIIDTIAGNGLTQFGGDGGAATNASLYHPIGVAIDSGGSLYIADSSHNRVRKVFSH